MVSLISSYYKLCEEGGGGWGGVSYILILRTGKISKSHILRGGGFLL